jgi:protein TonB
MRKVFTPPEIGGGWMRAVFGAILLTASVFLVLPLTQMLSAGRVDKVLTGLETATLEPPPPPPVVEEEEPEPEPEPEPVPELDLAANDMSFEIPSLDIGMGTGGALNDRLASFVGAAAQMDQAEVFELSDLDSKPMLVGPVRPKHPPSLLKQKVSGSVVLLFVVNDQGRVEEARVENSSRPEFEKPALDAVRRWKFKPGQREGGAVSVYVRQQIQFNVNS